MTSLLRTASRYRHSEKSDFAKSLSQKSLHDFIIRKMGYINTKRSYALWSLNRVYKAANGILPDVSNRLVILHLCS
jgi:hypothetical protein